MTTTSAPELATRLLAAATAPRASSPAPQHRSCDVPLLQLALEDLLIQRAFKMMMPGGRREWWQVAGGRWQVAGGRWQVVAKPEQQRCWKRPGQEANRQACWLSRQAGSQADGRSPTSPSQAPHLW